MPTWTKISQTFCPKVSHWEAKSPCYARRRVWANNTSDLRMVYMLFVLNEVPLRQMKVCLEKSRAEMQDHCVRFITRVDRSSYQPAKRVNVETTPEIMAMN